MSEPFDKYYSQDPCIPLRDCLPYSRHSQHPSHHYMRRDDTMGGTRSPLHTHVCKYRRALFLHILHPCLHLLDGGLAELGAVLVRHIAGDRAILTVPTGLAGLIIRTGEYGRRHCRHHLLQPNRITRIFLIHPNAPLAVQ